MFLKTYIYYISRRVLRTMQNDFRFRNGKLILPIKIPLSDFFHLEDWKT